MDKLFPVTTDNLTFLVSSSNPDCKLRVHTNASLLSGGCSSQKNFQTCVGTIRLKEMNNIINSQSKVLLSSQNLILIVVVSEGEL